MIEPVRFEHDNRALNRLAPSTGSLEALVLLGLDSVDKNGIFLASDSDVQKAANDRYSHFLHNLEEEADTDIMAVHGLRNLVFDRVDKNQSGLYIARYDMVPEETNKVPIISLSAFITGNALSSIEPIPFKDNRLVLQRYKKSAVLPTISGGVVAHRTDVAMSELRRKVETRRTHAARDYKHTHSVVYADRRRDASKDLLDRVHFWPAVID